jgi:hypothetical protein
MMTNPSEYRGAYGRGVDDRVEWRGQTGGSSICPWGLVNLIDEFRVALMPPRRRVWFLLGGVVSSSILWGDLETECLLEEVVDDGLDDDDPFFLVKKACSFLPHGFCTLLTNIYPGFSTGNKVHKYYFGASTTNWHKWFICLYSATTSRDLGAPHCLDTSVWKAIHQMLPLAGDY